MPEYKPQPERRLGMIGFGRIALPIIDCWNDGGLPGWTVAGVLARGSRQRGPVRSTDDAEAFFGKPFDLIIEAAGPSALAAHGERALGLADVWTVSAAALADATLFERLHDAGVRTGHRLRVMPGAIAGLDGVAMASVDPAAELRLDIDLLPGPGPRVLVFSGSVREAAMRFPDSVNVAAAAALAGPGLDKAQINVYHPGPVSRHRLALSVTSCFGVVQASVEPLRGPGVHPVAACLIAALRAESRSIWSG